MTATDAALAVGAQAPDLELTGPGGSSVSLASLWREKPLALVFLRPLADDFCIDNAMQLRDGDDFMRKAGGEFVAVCAGTPGAAAEFREQWHLPFPVLCDLKEQAYARYGVTVGHPGSFVIGTDGIVAFVHRNKDAVDSPSTWSLVDAVSTLTGTSVERPAPSPTGDEADAYDATGHAVPAPGGHSGLNFTCAKCGYNDCEVMDVSATSGMMSRMVNLQNRRFSAVACCRCMYTEFYKTESGALRNIFDLLVGS